MVRLSTKEKGGGVSSDNPVFQSRMNDQQSQSQQQFLKNGHGSSDERTDSAIQGRDDDYGDDRLDPDEIASNRIKKFDFKQKYEYNNQPNEAAYDHRIPAYEGESQTNPSQDENNQSNEQDKDYDKTKNIGQENNQEDDNTVENDDNNILQTEDTKFKKPLLCYLPVVKGPCFGYFPRYHYNFKTKTCESFVYGGCKGNLNNFEHKSGCVKTCKHDVPSWDVCQLPPKTGPCKAGFRKWYYDPNEQTCKTFVYGGCFSNGNNFDTMEDCMTSCGGTSDNSRTRIVVCHLRPKTGPCRAYIPRWHFDPEEQKCKIFIYGGCESNGNNFLTQEICNKECLNAVKRDDDKGSTDQSTKPYFCNMPVDPGVCLAYMMRYYYDKVSGECKTFIYGGCQGNRNNFFTKDECQTTCGVENEHDKTNDDDINNNTNKNWSPVCELPPKKGPCKAHMSRWYYDKVNNKCIKFWYGGCQSNGNNFLTRDKCQKTCYEPRFQQHQYYNKNKDSYKTNTYQDDDFDSKDTTNENRNEDDRLNSDNDRNADNRNDDRDNENIDDQSDTDRNDNARNFANYQKGNEYYSSLQFYNDSSNVCYGPPRVGPCKAQIPRWYYDNERQSCHMFYYGGCDPSPNNFETQEECKDTCDSDNDTDIPELCHLPSEVGSCFASLPRYYYNDTIGECMSFIYGGCLGNLNNFVNMDSCENTCVKKNRRQYSQSNQNFEDKAFSSEINNKKPSFCFLAPSTAPCKEFTPRYFYNHKTGKCQNFIYGGCQSNQNNFEDIQSCENSCGHDNQGNESNLSGPNYYNSNSPNRFNQNYQTQADNVYNGNKNLYNNNNEEDDDDQNDQQESSNERKNGNEEDQDDDSDDKARRDIAADRDYFANNEAAPNDDNANENRAAYKNRVRKWPSECELPPKTGPCEAHIKRWYFNPIQMICKPFVYGGCQGNANNFLTKETCMGHCRSTAASLRRKRSLDNNECISGTISYACQKLQEEKGKAQQNKPYNTYQSNFPQKYLNKQNFKEQYSSQNNANLNLYSKNNKKDNENGGTQTSRPNIYDTYNEQRESVNDRYTTNERISDRDFNQDDDNGENTQRFRPNNYVSYNNEQRERYSNRYSTENQESTDRDTDQDARYEYKFDNGRGNDRDNEDEENSQPQNTDQDARYEYKFENGRGNERDNEDENENYLSQ
ncbi:unnamed protein product, partial [Gordionus sp. m RMFG-2023]